MQSMIIDGYLAADPVLLSAQSDGRKRASFRLLETTRFRRRDGQPGERTTAFNCICFNAVTAEKYIGLYAKKGVRVVVQGHVENDSWTGKDGVEHYDLRLVVSDLRVKNRRDLAATSDAPSESAETDSPLDDDIPF
ncbi:MAG: single-stranded DNA-binding protein [Brevundimonas sp.]